MCRSQPAPGLLCHSEPVLAMVYLDLEPVCVVADARHVRGGGPQDAHGAGGAGGENDQQRPSLSTFCSPLLTCEYDTVCRLIGMLYRLVGTLCWSVGTLCGSVGTLCESVRTLWGYVGL